MILLRRTLLVAAFLTMIWAAVILQTGGIILEAGPFRLSSRNPRNVLIIAFLTAAAAWALSTPGRAGSFAEEWAWWRGGALGVWRGLLRVPRLLIPLASAATIAVVGVGVDVYQWAGPPPFWLDEETIVLNIRDRGFLELAGPLWFGQSAPLGWLALQRVVLLTLGPTELALRLVPLLFGIATVAAAVWIGSRWMGRLGAAVLVLLCWGGALIMHYRFEVKHYTADAFWGLLLPPLAMWALEGRTARDRTRRIVVWWGVAAVGQFFANGALLVTPACALFLCLMSWRREGLTAALKVVNSSAVWLAAFGAHYVLSVRYTHGSSYLRKYWVNDLPPDGVGLTATMTWLADRVHPIANNPGGTELWVSLWVLALAGFVLSFPRPLGFALALTIASAFVFAALGLVPLAQRLSLWMIPSLYFGVALAVDRVMRFASGGGHWRVPRIACAAGLVAVAIRLCADITYAGWKHREVVRPRDSKHSLDDKTSVRWLMGQHRPGDAIVATRLTWPAIWWYGEIAVGDDPVAGSKAIDRSRFFEVGHLAPGPSCGQRRLASMLQGHRRALVYIGFRDERAGFEDLLLRELDEAGAIVAIRQFADLSRAVVVELDGNESHAVASALPDRRGGARPPLSGCVNARRAREW